MASKKAKQTPVDNTPETEDENLDGEEQDVSDETDNETPETPPEEDENTEPETADEPAPEPTVQPLEKATHFRNTNITSLSFVTGTGKMYSFTDGVFSTYDQDVIERLKQTEDFKH